MSNKRKYSVPITVHLDTRVEVEAYSPAQAEKQVREEKLDSVQYYPGGRASTVRGYASLLSRGLSYGDYVLVIDGPPAQWVDTEITIHEAEEGSD